MKITVQDIFDLSEGLADLSEKELPISTSFKVARISRIVSQEFNPAESTRSKILEKYKEKDLGNGRVKLKKDKIGDYTNEINELKEQKIEIEIDKISIKDLKGINVKPKTLAQLHTILEEAK